MDSDDDYQQFSPPQQPSSPLHQRKLKRLKKSIMVSSERNYQPTDPIPSPEATDSTIDSDHESLKTLDVESGGGNDTEEKLDDLFAYRDSTEEDRVVFDSEEGQEGRFGVPDVTEVVVEGEKIGDEKEKKKKKKKSRKRVMDVDDKGDPEVVPLVNKRKLEKERKAHLEQLHSESQRLLRETRDAAFKPVPLVQKPISSILEKIRVRKLEVSKKTSMSNNHVEATEFVRDVVIDLYPEQVGDVDKEQAEEERDTHLMDKENRDVDASQIESSSENASLPSTSTPVLSNTKALDEESKIVFRAPIDDTQALLNDSQHSDGEDMEDCQEDRHMEEVFAPSVLTMNLKLDSAPPDDVSSDEENYDKENINPHPHKQTDADLYPKGDPVKAFVDDEAEEDDSDNELMQFKENEDDEENEESEEFNDLIETGFKENPSDNVKRDQLHQMWLEQQDAAATDNVLQRLKCGGKQHREPIALEEVEEEDDDYTSEDSMDDTADGLLPASVARINSRKVKQMIPQMFTDKDDVFLSSDDEETEQKLVKMCLLEKSVEHTSFLSPAEDENSREVFGLIKKLNIAPDRKKAKSSSFFDTFITGGNSNSSSKSSFLGRAPSNSLPSSNKNCTSNFRSFIFGRDDSNSRSAITTSEGSSDMAENSNRTTKSASAKFSNSQSKFNSQKRSQTSSSSLLEILRKSTQSDNNIGRSNTVGQTQVAVQFAAFKSGKSVKIGTRN